MKHLGYSALLESLNDPNVASQFFQVALELYKLKNFASLPAVVMALLSRDYDAQSVLSALDCSLLGIYTILANHDFYKRELSASPKQYLPIAAKVSHLAHRLHESFLLREEGEDSGFDARGEESAIENLLAYSSRANHYDSLEARPDLVNFLQPSSRGAGPVGLLMRKNKCNSACPCSGASQAFLLLV